MKVNNINIMKRLILIILSFAFILGLGIVYTTYKWIYEPNINSEIKELSIKIPSKSSFNDVFEILKSKNILKDTTSFKRIANFMKYNKEKVPSGVYQIQAAWNNRQLIGHLRSGNQAPMKVTFNNVRTIQELSGKITSYLEPDSLDFLNYILNKQKLSELGYTPENVMSLFIPNTYNFYWDIDSEDIIDRMKKEHDSFWSDHNRIKKANDLGLTKQEVYTLASIVEKESIRNNEKPIIAGLYLNRLKRGILLQADPTVVFAVGDFSIRRVLNKHLAHESPFNTYKNAGLPPGPIYMPSIKSIDAVLNPAEHEYLYMCAKPGYNSEHAFAETDIEHARNANKYRAWLNKERIKK